MACSEFVTYIRSVAQHLKAGHRLIGPDQRGKSLTLLDGWMIRQVALVDGRCQVTALFLPGDVFDLNADRMAECGYTLKAVTDCEVAEISASSLQRLTAQNPDLRDAFIWEQLDQMANQTEWLANLGQRTARERLAHFFCEVFSRLKAVGLTTGNECRMPLTQSVLSEVTGMTPVHLNRSLQKLRADGIIELRAGKLRILDPQALADRGVFDPAYLHLGGQGSNLAHDSSEVQTDRLMG